MSKAVRVLIVVWGCFSLWTLAGWFVVRSIESPPFVQNEHRSGYEIRDQEAYLMARVQIAGPWAEALDQGRRIIEDYLSGNNTTQSSIAMTLPVDIQEPEGETIALAAPLVQEQKNGQWLVSFILPSKYTTDTLPRPNDPRIRLVNIPAQRIAVAVFGGWADHRRVEAEQEELGQLLSQDKEIIISPFRVVQYGIPWAPPFVQRNEIIVTIR